MHLQPEKVKFWDKRGEGNVLRVHSMITKKKNLQAKISENSFCMLQKIRTSLLHWGGVTETDGPIKGHPPYQNLWPVSLTSVTTAKWLVGSKR